jgi:hypothetical protein
VGVGFAAGFGVGLGVAFGFGVGLGVGLGVGFGVGLGVGVGGAATVSVGGVTRMLSQVCPSPNVARKTYGHDPAGSLCDPLYETPAAKSVPVVWRTVDVPAIRSVTDCGAAPVVSVNWTANENVVAVVPEPGSAVPFRIVTVPHVRANAGPAPTPIADTRSAPTTARPVTRHALAPRSGAAARRHIPWAMPAA